MTLLDAQERLLEWFLENEGFDVSVDFDNVLEKISMTRDEDKALYLAALESFTKNDMLVKLDVRGNTIWKLVKPLRMHSQTVELSYPVAKAIANTINNFSEATGGAERVVESFRVGEQEVATLVQIIEQLSRALADK